MTSEAMAGLSTLTWGMVLLSPAALSVLLLWTCLGYCSVVLGRLGSVVTVDLMWFLGFLAQGGLLTQL